MLGGIAFQLRKYYTIFICYYYYPTETSFFFNSPVVIIIYAFCAGEFFVRYLWKRPIRAIEPIEHYDEDAAAESSKYDSNGRGEMSHKMQLMVVALCFSTLCLLIR